MRGGCLGHVLWRSAFQARRPRRAYPRTSSPVTIATLCTAFQADRPQRNIIAHELHEWTRRLCDTRMATGSVALIYTNAMGGYMTTTGTTWDNLKLSFAGATEMPRNIIAHELLEIFFLPTNCTNGHEGYALRKMATGSVARICTNAMSSLFTCPVA